MAIMQTVADVNLGEYGDVGGHSTGVQPSENHVDRRVATGVTSSGQGMITLLLVDDQPQVLRGLEMRLALEPDVVVVGVAADAETALRLAEQLMPDVIVMDVELPGMDGITATQALKRRWPDRAIIVLSLHDDSVTQLRAKQAGASAFVAKHRMEGPLLAAIREAADYGRF